MCGAVGSEAITKHLMNFCAPPFHVCALPGTLRLPTAARGTLFLTDVAALTLRQQIVVNDWISAEHGWVGMDRGGIGESPGGISEDRGGIGEGRGGIGEGRGGIGEGRGGIGAGRGDVQIVSMTSAPLWPLVVDGDFLEGLFFRLNVVCLEAQSTEDGRSTSSENRDIAIDRDPIRECQAHCPE